MAADDEPVYCLCRLPYDDTRFMIECDVCNDWFHGNCVGVQEHQASDIEIYHCPNCQKENGPLTLKKRRNWHRHDYSETDSSKAVQTGTVTFIKELKNRNFPSADEIPILRVKGNDLIPTFFEENGFDVPMLVGNKEGLEIEVPPADFSIQDIENLVGSMREIDVIDVARQEDYKMLMREWTEYYNSPDRDKIFNVISLEFSNTKLSELVIPPKIVRQVSWVNNMWPDNLPDDCTYSRPEVQKYCLMGVQDSFTDFHIDFGGTSVWYHVLRGEKVFYLIRPTPANMNLYESWISSSNQSETFFGDQVDNCYKSVVTDGQTLFIPTGWIHAVFTPVDTLVFGGNFLHSYNIPLQLQVYEVERQVKTPEKYLFPSFETICWYAAKFVLDILKECEEDSKRPANYVVAGAKSLAQHLKSWTQRKDLNSQYIFAKSAKHDVPEHIQYGKLLKELIKVSRNFEVQAALKPKVERKRRKKNVPTPKQMESLDILHQHTTEKLQELQKQEHKIEEHKNVYAFSDDPPSPPPSSLKMRIPKTGAFFDSMLKTVKEEEEENLNPVDISSLKLKVSNGRIVGDNAKPDVLNIGKFQPLVTDFDDDGDSDPDQLVVDESPTVRKKNKPGENNSRTTMKPGSLKMKLSFSGKCLNDGEEKKNLELGGPPPAKRQRKVPAVKKEKKPAAAPKVKAPGAKATATKKEPKEPKKTQAKTPKGKAKQNKSQDGTLNPSLYCKVLGSELLEQKLRAADGSKLNIKLQQELLSGIKPDPLTIKVKPDYLAQRVVIDPITLKIKEDPMAMKLKEELKTKKQKGEPKARKATTKKPRGPAVANVNKEEPVSKKVKGEPTPKAAKGDSTSKKSKPKEPEIKQETLLLDTKIEPLLPDNKYELPFLETRFEPLLEIKSDTPSKKPKGVSKKGRGVSAKKAKEESKGKGGSKKVKAEAVLSEKKPLELGVNGNTALDILNTEQLMINIKDRTTPKKSKADPSTKKAKAKPTPKKTKDNAAANKAKGEATQIDKSGVKGTIEEPALKKAKAEPAVKKTKSESAVKKGKLDPLLLNIKPDSKMSKSNRSSLNESQRNSSSLASGHKDKHSLKMAWSESPLMASSLSDRMPLKSPHPERRPLTSPQPDLQSLMAIRANLQSLTSSRSDTQPLTSPRQDLQSLTSSKQNSPLKTQRSDPFSLLSKRTDSLSSKHIKSNPLSLTSTRPDPLSLIPKKPDPLSLISKKPDPLSLIPKKPDPLSLIPKKPDPLSLIPKKPDPLSLIPQKPDPLSLTSKKPDALSLIPRRPDPLSLTASRPDPLSLLSNRPDPMSLMAAKPDPLSVAFLNNKEPLTSKERSLTTGSPKLASLAKKMSMDQLVDQPASKLKISEIVTTAKESSKAGGKKAEECNRTPVDNKVDQLASILKSESLLSKARFDTLKPPEALPAKTKEVGSSPTQTPKPAEKLPVREKSLNSPAVKLKPPDLLGGSKISASMLLDPKSKPEALVALRAELHAKQLAMQAKIAEEEGGGKKDLSVTETEQSKRMNMPTIRGGLNCGIADILEASGYGTETDFQVDEDVRAPSPTMRDAIQGMLSMSRMGGLQLFSGSAGVAPGTGRSRKQWAGHQPDEEEQLGVCYKDDEYIYPSLELSDDEDQHIFKPRGKQKKDETWNPKARVQVSSEKRERIARDSARRESMESTLAATAAKYESIAQMKPKKGNRKRLKSEDIPEDTQPSTLLGHPLSHPLTPAAVMAAAARVAQTIAPAVASTSSAADIGGTTIAGTPSKLVAATTTIASSSATVVVASTSGTVAVAGPSSGGGGGGLPHSRPLHPPSSCPSKPKKPKKGFATAKQRLGRILKIHKMRF